MRPWILLVLWGCAAPVQPRVGVETVHLVPTEDEGLTAYSTWSWYDSPEGQLPTSNHFLCASLVRFEGVRDATPACPDCTLSFSGSAVMLQTDCEVALPAWTTDVRALGLGVPDERFLDLDPYGGASPSLLVQDAGGWSAAGVTFPAQGTLTAWDGQQHWVAWGGFLASAIDPLSSVVPAKP